MKTFASVQPFLRGQRAAVDRSRLRIVRDDDRNTAGGGMSVVRPNLPAEVKKQLPTRTAAEVVGEMARLQDEIAPRRVSDKYKEKFVSPLWGAVTENDIAAVRELVADPGRFPLVGIGWSAGMTEKMACQGNYEVSALHWAARNNSPSMIAELIRLGADVNHMTKSTTQVYERMFKTSNLPEHLVSDNDRKTALDWALDARPPAHDAVAELRKHGGKSAKEILEQGEIAPRNELPIDPEGKGMSAEEIYQQGNKHYEKEGYADAAKWIRRAAEQGHAQAQHHLGVLYNNGQGVSIDHAEAAKWYRRAAEQGHTHAQLFLSAMYKFGDGVPQDDAEAATWFRRGLEELDANPK